MAGHSEIELSLGPQERAEGKSRLGGAASLSDGMVNQGLGMKESFEEIVPLAFENDQLDQVFRASLLVLTDEFGGVWFQRHNFISIAMDERDRDARAGKHINVVDRIKLGLAGGEVRGR